MCEFKLKKRFSCWRSKERNSSNFQEWYNFILLDFTRLIFIISNSFKIRNSFVFNDTFFLICSFLNQKEWKKKSIAHTHYIYIYIYIYIIIIIMSCRSHGYPWPSLATSPYRSSPLAGLQGYMPYPLIATECMFELVVLILPSHMWESIGVYPLWARPCFSSSVLHVWFV